MELSAVCQYKPCIHNLDLFMENPCFYGQLAVNKGHQTVPNKNYIFQLFLRRTQYGPDVKRDD
jgi:hypothetical protein